jgi:hypothetical protein
MRHEDVWGNSRLEGLQGEDRDYVYDRGRTTVSEQWRARSILVDEVFKDISLSLDQGVEIFCDYQQTVGLLTKVNPKLKIMLRQKVNIHISWNLGNPRARCGMIRALIAPTHQGFIKVFGLREMTRYQNRWMF